MLHSEPEQSICSLDSKLAADVRSMIFDRAVMDGEFRAYLFARQAIGDREQDTAFRRSEIADKRIILSLAGGAVTLKQLQGDRCTHKDLSASDRMDSGDDLLGRTVFEQVAFAARFHGVAKEVFVTMKGEEDDPCL